MRRLSWKHGRLYHAMLCHVTSSNGLRTAAEHCKVKSELWRLSCAGDFEVEGSVLRLIMAWSKLKCAASLAAASPSSAELN